VLTHEVVKPLKLTSPEAGGDCNLNPPPAVLSPVQQTPQAPQAPQTLPTPVPARAPSPQAFVVNENAVPRTGDEFRALQQKIEDLKGELQNAAERRSTVASRLREADIDARPGYIQRLNALDTRIMAVENEITASVAALSRTPAAARLEASSQVPDPAVVFDRVSNDIIPIVAILSVFVLGPLAFAIARLIWRRGTNAPRVSAATDHATQQKLDQLQQAVDTIAIEVERISEGQRFVTKLMSDRSIGAGAAEPVHAPRKAAVPSERG